MNATKEKGLLMPHTTIVEFTSWLLMQHTIIVEFTGFQHYSCHILCLVMVAAAEHIAAGETDDLGQYLPAAVVRTSSAEPSFLQRERPLSLVSGFAPSYPRLDSESNIVIVVATKLTDRQNNQQTLNNQTHLMLLNLLRITSIMQVSWNDNVKNGISKKVDETVQEIQSQCE
jgi:hypothetical protein